MPEISQMLADVAARKLAQDAIRRAIARLAPPEQLQALLEVVLELQQQGAGAASPAAPPKVARPAHVPPRAASSGRAPAALKKKSLADLIVEWCQKQGVPDGTYSTAEVAKYVLPVGANPAMVHTAITRSSPQSDRGMPKKPRFFRLPGGRFRLYRPGDEKRVES